MSEIGGDGGARSAWVERQSGVRRGQAPTDKGEQIGQIKGINTHCFVIVVGVSISDMPRRRRADEAGGLYHALNRGNAR